MAANLVDVLVASAWSTGRGGCTVVDRKGGLFAQLGRRIVYFCADRNAAIQANDRIRFMQVEFSNFSNDF